MTPTGTGKRPACQLAGRTAKRRAPLDDTAQKDNRGIAEEAAEDTPMMQHPRCEQHRAFQMPRIFCRVSDN